MSSDSDGDEVVDIEAVEVSPEPDNIQQRYRNTIQNVFEDAEMFWLDYILSNLSS